MTDWLIVLGVATLTIGIAGGGLYLICCAWADEMSWPRPGRFQDKDSDA